MFKLTISHTSSNVVETHTLTIETHDLDDYAPESECSCGYPCCTGCYDDEEDFDDLMEEAYPDTEHDFDFWIEEAKRYPIGSDDRAYCLAQALEAD